MRKKRTDQKGAPGICVNEKTTLEEEKLRHRRPQRLCLNSMEELVETNSQVIIKI
jgi:hypothetical protein